MKLLLIKQSGSPLDISNDKLEIDTIYFESEKYKGKLQEFVSSLAVHSFDGIIISDTLDNSLNYLGLEVCLRIRLSSKELGQKALASFFILNSKNPQEIYKYQIQQKTNTTASLFFTDGTYIFDDIESLQYLIENDSNYKILTEANFNENFLDVIQLKKNPLFGNHTIANIWGAIRFAEVTGNDKLLQDYFNNNPKVSESQSDMYFKLLISKNSFANHSPIARKTINSTGKNILLIDDEEDKGWGLLLQEVFQGSNFESVKKSSTFIDDIRRKIKEQVNGIIKWDLILLDLRLLENEDKGDESLKTGSEYSGGKILKEIKNENKGAQVIMFTASNKAWNMKELQELGADGFYIKESPEYSKDHTFSINSFGSLSKQIKICFDNEFLKQIYHKGENIVKKLNSISSVGGGAGLMALSKHKLKNEITLQINQSFELLRSAYLNELNFTMSFLSYFKIIELMNDYFLEYEAVNNKFIHKATGKTLEDCKFDSGRYVFSTQSRWDPYKTSTPLKFYNVLQYELGFNISSVDKNIAQRIYEYNNLRKDIVHPKDLSTYRKGTKNDNIKIINDLEAFILKLT